MGDCNMAVAHLKALDSIKNIEGAEIEVATAYSNLAASFWNLIKRIEAIKYLDEALTIYRKDEVKIFIIVRRFR